MRKIKILALVLGALITLSLLAGCSYNPAKEDMTEYVNLYDLDKINYELAEKLYNDYRTDNALTTSSIQLSIGDVVDFYITTELVGGSEDNPTYTRVENMCYDTDDTMYSGYRVGESKTNYLFDFGLRWKVENANVVSQEHRSLTLGKSFSFTAEYDEDYDKVELAGNKVRFTVLVTKVYPTGEYISSSGSYDYNDGTIYSSIESFFQNYQSNKDVVEIGDWVIISFEGSVSGKTFDGGSDDNYGLQVGNGYLFNRFENGLLGHKVGDEFVIGLTIPSSYSNEEVAGKDAEFNVKIKAIYDADKTVKDNTVFDSLYDLKNSLRVKNYTRFEIMTYVTDNSTIKKYPEKMLTQYNKICRETIEANIQYVEEYYKSYGMSYSRNEIIVSMYGTTDLDSYIDQQAKAEVKRILTGYAVLQKLGLSYTDDDYKRDLTNQTIAMNYSSGTNYTEKDIENTYNKDRLRGYFIIDVCGEALWDNIDAPSIP
ncbi:MAG: FKBP-type peptidyl-prolyl cis-trans isomerase [Clostridiales bacterium]|nr:FKBP-type peptidyl-prolyl cis-trans isomerase [Clostridiales bacterium]